MDIYKCNKHGLSEPRKCQLCYNPIEDIQMGKSGIQKIELIIVLIILNLSFLPKMITNPINTDESYWISTSSYFEDWISFDTKAESWQLNFMTLSGPNLPKYLIAIGRLLGGFGKNDLNKSYNYSNDYKTNEIEGRLPSLKLLIVSRVPMVTLSILLGLLMYIFLHHEINRFFAIVWLIFFVQNNALTQILLLAMSEAPLIFFSITALLFTFIGQKYWIAFLKNEKTKKFQRRVYLFFGLAGFSIGLAASSKIHAFLLLIPYGLLLFYLIFVPLSSLSKKEKYTHFIRIVFLSGFLAFLVFIFINPFLYENPITNIIWFFKYRINEMGIQAHQYTQLSSLPFLQRIYVILSKHLSEFASIRGKIGIYINAFLLVFGGILIFRDIVNTIKNRLYFNPISFIFLFFSLLVLSAFLSPLLWLRYFLFPIFIITLVDTITITFLINYLLKHIKKSKVNKPQIIHKD